MNKIFYLTIILSLISLILGAACVYLYFVNLQLQSALKPVRDLLIFDYSGLKPEPKNPSIMTPQVMITYPNRLGMREYAKAILKIASTAMSEYHEVFWMSSPNIHIFIYINPEKKTTLSATPLNYRIYLYLRSIDDFKPKSLGGCCYHVYGFIHEIAHIMFSTNNPNFNEGWAFYAASVIVDRVYRILGDDAWPQPYNYSKTEGLERLIKAINAPEGATPVEMRYVVAAAKILYTIGQKYGTLIFKEALNRIKPTPTGIYGYPIYDLEEFKTSLAEVTRDPSILDLFKESGF